MATGERLKALQGRLPVHSLEKTLHPGESLQAILAESLTEKVRLFFHFTYQEIVMKRLIVPLLLVGAFIALTTMEASAVVCATGVYRAGCVAARPVVVAAAPVRRRVY
jgi:hypothetical protein